MEKLTGESSEPNPDGTTYAEKEATALTTEKVSRVGIQKGVFLHTEIPLFWFMKHPEGFKSSFFWFGSCVGSADSAVQQLCRKHVGL